MIDTLVFKIERLGIDISTDDSVLSVDERILERIIENRCKRARRHFGIVDLWNIRRKGRSFNTHR